MTTFGQHLGGISRPSRMLALAAILLLAPGCGGGEQPRRVDFGKKAESVPAAVSLAASRSGLRVALGGIITPREGLSYYRELIAYIGDKLAVPMLIVDKEDYGEINRLLKSGALDFAFVCSGPYVDGKKDFGLELVAAPQAYGKTVYHSYFIVPEKSPAQSLDDLQGRKFAFTDPLSNTGCLVPTYMLATRGRKPETFFGDISYSHGHDKSIRLVAEGAVDGAAVDSLIFDYFSKTQPLVTSRTRVIFRSPPYAIPPVAVRPGLDQGLKKSLEAVLLGAHTDPRGKAILDKMMIDRFVTIADADYDSIRQMQSWMASRQEKTAK